MNKKRIVIIVIIIVIVLAIIAYFVLRNGGGKGGNFQTGKGVYSTGRRTTQRGTDTGWVSYGPEHVANELLGYYMGATDISKLESWTESTQQVAFGGATEPDGRTIIIMSTRPDGGGDHIIVGYGKDIHQK